MSHQLIRLPSRSAPGAPFAINDHRKTITNHGQEPESSTGRYSPPEITTYRIRAAPHGLLTSRSAGAAA